MLSISLGTSLYSGRHWISPAQFSTALQPHLQPLLQAPAQPSLPRPIHAGQFWHLSPALSPHPQRTIYVILPAQTLHGPPRARAWLPTNAHSHVSPMPGDQYQWTPTSPHLPSSNSQVLSFTNIPPGTSWNKILCQTPPSLQTHTIHHSSESTYAYGPHPA